MACSLRESSTRLVGLFLACLLGLVPQAAAGDARAEPRDVALELVLAITVNAPAIEDGDRRLGAHMAANVIAGTGAFVVTAGDYEGFAQAIRRKLLREIPAPLAGLSDRARAAE